MTTKSADELAAEVFTRENKIAFEEAGLELNWGCVENAYLSGHESARKELRWCIREICLRARDKGRYQEACFYTNKKDESEHFDLWFEKEYAKIFEVEK